MKAITNEFIQSHAIVVQNETELNTLIENSNIDKDFALRNQVVYPSFVVSKVHNDSVNSFIFELESPIQIEGVANSFKSEVINFSEI